MAGLSMMIKGEFKAIIEFLAFRRHPIRTFPTGFFTDDFILVKETGTYRHKVKAGMFCGVCVPLHRVYARMNKGRGGWTCFTCGKQYADPGGISETVL
jgi:hypothetical protein